MLLCLFYCIFSEISESHVIVEYSVGQFYEDARQATRDVLNKGHVPIITGGTGLYLRWYVSRTSLLVCLDEPL